MPAPGLFVVVEGPEGSGKSTLVRALAERMTAAPGSKRVERAKKRLVQTDLANVRKVQNAKARRAR